MPGKLTEERRELIYSCYKQLKDNGDTSSVQNTARIHNVSVRSVYKIIKDNEEAISRVDMLEIDENLQERPSIINEQMRSLGILDEEYNRDYNRMWEYVNNIYNIDPVDYSNEQMFTLLYNDMAKEMANTIYLPRKNKKHLSTKDALEAMERIGTNSALEAMELSEEISRENRLERQEQEKLEAEQRQLGAEQREMAKLNLIERNKKILNKFIQPIWSKAYINHIKKLGDKKELAYIMDSDLRYMNGRLSNDELFEIELIQIKFFAEERLEIPQIFHETIGDIIMLAKRKFKEINKKIIKESPKQVKQNNKIPSLETLNQRIKNHREEIHL